MKEKIKIIPLTCILLICYMYIVTVSSLFNIRLDIFQIMNNRNILLAGVVALWAFGFLSKKKLKINIFIISALLLSLYMILLGIKHYDNLLSWLSCTSLWAIILLISYNYEYNIKTKEIITKIFCITSIILSYIYVYGVLFSNTPRTVASANSIYYVLAILPFVFFLNKNVHKMIMMIITTIAIVISGKTTCLIPLLPIYIIFFNNYLKENNKKLEIKFVRIIILIIVIFSISTITNIIFIDNSLMETLNHAIFEIKSGGNGRNDIYKETITEYKELSIDKQIIGNGYYSINKRIGIGTHNDFLMVLYNYGLIGLSLYIFFIINMIKEYKKLGKDNINEKNAYLSSVVVFLCMSLASNILNTQIQLLILCIFWGIITKKKEDEIK